jgi:hypothetical protein
MLGVILILGRGARFCMKVVGCVWFIVVFSLRFWCCFFVLVGFFLFVVLCGFWVLNGFSVWWFFEGGG